MSSLDAFDVLIGHSRSFAERQRCLSFTLVIFDRTHREAEPSAHTLCTVQCPWRFDSPIEIVTGLDDLSEYAGPGERPPNWSFEDGQCLQDQRFDDLLGPRDESTRSWVNERDCLVVTSAQQTDRGDVLLELTGGYTIILFPASCEREAWRLFAPEMSDHRVFPDEGEGT
jgi:hypothetical protein